MPNTLTPETASAKRPVPLLTKAERAQLLQLEDVLATAHRWQVEAVKALVLIRDKKLYRLTHNSFEKYAQQRWGYERAYLYQLCQWGETVQNLSAIADTVPERESHARPLYGLDAKEQRAAWKAYTKRRTGKDSARAIEAVVRGVVKADRSAPVLAADREVVNGLRPVFKTKLGSLFNCDCMVLLKRLRNDSVDLLFADPPFNCGKEYGVAVGGKRIHDVLPDEEYLAWCQRWLDESIRVLKPGGSLFIYNIARWNTRLGAYLQGKPEMDFRHWITVNINGQMPIKDKLLPQGYSLLYFTKGKPKTFHRIWTPIQRCRKCEATVKDYGGYLEERQEKQPGILLSDVWSDITAVRHGKFKSEKRAANQLSTKILERVIAMASDKGNLVVDTFGGSGTTYSVCEEQGRRWIGAEFGSCDAIVERLSTRRVDNHRNDDIVDAE